MVTSSWGATVTHTAVDADWGLGAIQTKPRSWHYAEGSPTGGKPSPPAPCNWGGRWPLRMILERKPELENPVHWPGRVMKEQGNHLTDLVQKPGQMRRTSGAHLPSTLSSKSSYWEEMCLGLVMERRTTPSRPLHLNPPHRVPMNGLAGTQSRWTCQPGGRNSRKLVASMTSGNLPEGWGYHFN